MGTGAIQRGIIGTGISIDTHGITVTITLLARFDIAIPTHGRTIIVGVISVTLMAATVTVHSAHIRMGTRASRGSIISAGIGIDTRRLTSSITVFTRLQLGISTERRTVIVLIIRITFIAAAIIINSPHVSMGTGAFKGRVGGTGITIDTHGFTVSVTLLSGFQGAVATERRTIAVQVVGIACMATPIIIHFAHIGKYAGTFHI